MKNRIFDNWVLKFTSVVIAVVLWIIGYSINDPADSRRMTNVPVTFINTEAITEKGQVYEVLEGTDVVRSITLNATRSIIDDLEDNDINVEADFSKMKLDGTVEIKIYSDRHNDAITFKPSSTEVKLLVEDKIERYFSLNVELIGEPKEGYIVGSSKLDWNRISVSGAESRVKAIDKAVAVVDITDTSGDIFSYADIVLYDKSGNEISKKDVNVSIKNVGATVEILDTKTVPIIFASTGVAAENYVTTGEVIGDVTEIKIAGKEQVLSTVNEIVVEGEELYFEDATEDVVLNIDIDDYLPMGIIRANKQGSGHIEVTVKIAPIIEREYTLHMGRAQIENVPEGYSVVHVLDSAEMKVMLRGAQHLLDELSLADIKITLDVTAWMEANEVKKLEHEEVYIVAPVYELGEGIEVIDTTPVEIIAKVLEE